MRRRLAQQVLSHGSKRTYTERSRSFIMVIAKVTEIFIRNASASPKQAQEI